MQIQSERTVVFEIQRRKILKKERKKVMKTVCLLFVASVLFSINLLGQNPKNNDTFNPENILINDRAGNGEAVQTQRVEISKETVKELVLSPEIKKKLDRIKKGEVLPGSTYFLLNQERYQDIVNLRENLKDSTNAYRKSFVAIDTLKARTQRHINDYTMYYNAGKKEGADGKQVGMEPDIKAGLVAAAEKMIANLDRVLKNKEYFENPALQGRINQMKTIKKNLTGTYEDEGGPYYLTEHGIDLDVSVNAKEWEVEMALARALATEAAKVIEEFEKEVGEFATDKEGQEAYLKFYKKALRKKTDDLLTLPDK